MQLSIIIPMYNVEKYINQCINSVLNQGFNVADYEVILVDDGSSDATYATSKEYVQKHSNIRLVSQKNSGVSAARNKGMDMAQGIYIYFIDSDDYIVSNTLKGLVDTAIKNKLDVLEFKLVRTKFRDENSISLNETDINYNFDVQTGKEYIGERSFHDSNCVYFYRRQFVIDSNVRFIEGRTKQDLMFNVEIIPLADRITHIPMYVYRYVINPNSIWTSTESRAYRKSIEDFIFMVKRYSNIIQRLEKDGYNTVNLNSKMQTMLFNIFKRLLKSDLSIQEFKQTILELRSVGLYPMISFDGNHSYRKLLTEIFRKKYLFYFAIWFYRTFKVPIESILVKNYRNKRELKINQ